MRFTQLPTRSLVLDEAATQIRVAGYTLTEITRMLYDGQPRTALTLRRATEVNSSSSAGRLITSLVKEDIQHPPLFYLAELGIVRAFGDSLFAWRFLPALFGLLAIPAAYALARESFSDARTGLLAAALFAVSPIERIYSQQAREYSLLTLLVLLATLAALRAVRTNSLRWWTLYAVLIAAGLYASPFMAYVMVAHLVFAIGAERHGHWRTFVRFAGASAAALAAYTPWLRELAIHRNDVVDTNVWSATPWPVIKLAAKWIFNTGSSFFDLEYIDLRWSVVLAIVAVVAAIAIVRGFRLADAEARWCLGAAVVVPAILLVVPDIIFGEHRSSVARYGLSVFSMLLIITARGLLGRPVAATIILAAGICASAVGSAHATWWDNDMYADDRQIARLISSEPRAQLVSTIGLAEFVTFAQVLDNDVRVSLSPRLSTVRFSAADPLFVLRPSPADLLALQKRSGFTFVPVPYTRTITAHEMGTRIADTEGIGTAATELYRAVPDGVSRPRSVRKAAELDATQATPLRSTGAWMQRGAN